MTEKKFVELETGMLSDFGLDEKWLQSRIAEKPEILGIPGVFLRDKERRQPRAGRLDLLLETEDNDDKKRRYEVEVQIGPTDESHIIRTIEYWDLERKRFPQYDHCAVIVAGEITSRFFNVINLFNGYIPIIAIKVLAVKQAEGEFGLVFDRILHENRWAPEESEILPTASREEWIARKGERANALAEYLCGKLGTTPRYTKSYIGMDDANAVLQNKVNLRRRGQQHRQLIRIDFTMEQLPTLTAGFEKEDLCSAEGWGALNDGSGYVISFATEKQIDDNIGLVRSLYRAAAGISALSDNEAEGS